MLLTAQISYEHHALKAIKYIYVMRIILVKMYVISIR